MEEISRSPMRAGMLDDQRWDRDRKSCAPYHFAECIVVGKLVDDRMKAADHRQRGLPERDRRAKAWFGETKLEPEQHARQKVMIDCRRGKASPQARRRGTAVKTGHK